MCGSHGACLDCMLPNVLVTAGLGFFLRLSHLCHVIMKIVTRIFSAFKSFMSRDNEDCDYLL